MPEKIPFDSPLGRLFREALAKAFREFRHLYSPPVERHLGDEVLREFVHVDHIFRLRDTYGRRVEELPDMLRVASEREGPERRIEVDSYIGDFLLFMGGFFPGSLRRERWLVPAPMIARVGSLFVRFSEPLEYYAAEGRNAYERAARTARLFAPEEGGMYDLLSSRFDEYQRLLGRVKDLVGERPEVTEIEDILG